MILKVFSIAVVSAICFGCTAESNEAEESNEAGDNILLAQRTLRYGDECGGPGPLCPSSPRRFCYPGPHPRVLGSRNFYCIPRDYHCALPGELGGFYGDTTVVGGKTLTCCNPNLFGYEGKNAQFFDQRCNDRDGGPL